MGLRWLSRFKLIRLWRIIEYRILYRVEDSRRRCLGMGGGMDANIYIACLRQVVAFAPKVIIIACLRQGFCIRKTR